MKTIKKIIKETVDHVLDERGLLGGDLSDELSDKIWTAIQERKERRGEACPTEWMSALMRFCGASPYTASAALRSQISECGKSLIRAGAELSDLGEFAAWWEVYTSRWTNPSIYPTPKQIGDSWQKFLDSRRAKSSNAIPAEVANKIFSARL